MWWHYLIWIPATILFYVIYSYLSWKNNQESGWLVWIILFGAFPVWVFVSRISKNLLFDGMLYDNLMFLTYVCTMIAIGAHGKLSSLQWLGVVLVVLGSVLMRVETS